MSDMDLDEFYRSPIHIQLQGMRMAMEQKATGAVMRAVQNMQIEINEQELVDVLNADRKRYRQAWHDGYETCRARYEERLARIAALANEEDPVAKHKEGQEDADTEG